MELVGSPAAQLGKIAATAFSAVRVAQVQELDSFHDEVASRITSRYARRGQDFTALPERQQAEMIKNEVAEFESQLRLYVFADGSHRVANPLAPDEAKALRAIAFASVFQDSPTKLAQALEERFESFQTLHLGAFDRGPYLHDNGLDRPPWNGLDGSPWQLSTGTTPMRLLAPSAAYRAY